MVRCLAIAFILSCLAAPAWTQVQPAPGAAATQSATPPTKPAAKKLKKLTKGMTVKAIEIAKTFAKADKNGKVVKLAEPTIAYEADVEKDGKSGEFAVSADGKVLESPKWAEADDEKSEGKKSDKKD